MPSLDDLEDELCAFDVADSELSALDAGFEALLKQEQERAARLAQAEEGRKKQEQLLQKQKQQKQKQAAKQGKQGKQGKKLTYVRSDVLSAWADTYKMK